MKIGQLLRFGMVFGVILALGGGAAFSEDSGDIIEASKIAGSLLQMAKDSGDSSTPLDLSYSAICPSGIAEARKKRRADNLRLIEAEVRPQLEALIKKYKLPQPPLDSYSLSIFRSITYTYHKLDEQKEIASVFSEVLERAVLKHVPLPDFSRIRGNVIAQIQNSATLDQSTKNDLISRANLVGVMMASQYIRDYIKTFDDFMIVLGYIMADVSSNASYNDLGGASNPKIAPGQSYVIIYPGLLLAEMRQGDDRPYLDFVLSHETSHAFDPEIFPWIYEGYKQCMKETFGKDFSNWDEVITDYWGKKSTLTLNSSNQSNPDYMQKSYEILCDSVSEDESPNGPFIASDHPSAETKKSVIKHPSGEYRIQNILLRNDCSL